MTVLVERVALRTKKGACPISRFAIENYIPYVWLFGLVVEGEAELGVVESEGAPLDAVGPEFEGDLLEHVDLCRDDLGRPGRVDGRKLFRLPLLDKRDERVMNQLTSSSIQNPVEVMKRSF